MTAPAGRATLVAHRGIVPGQPENTLAALGQAIALGIPVVEVDLTPTRDGAVVIMHDATVDRTTDGQGAVADLTLAEIKRLDAGDGERVPTFDEVLQLARGRRTRLLLDIKENISVDRVVRRAASVGCLESIIVGVRSVEDHEAVKAADHRVPTLGFVRRIEDIEGFVAAGVDGIRLWSRWIKADSETLVRTRRLERPIWVSAFPIDVPELEMHLASGVDAVITDLTDDVLRFARRAGLLLAPTPERPKG